MASADLRAMSRGRDGPLRPRHDDGRPNLCDHRRSHRRSRRSCLPSLACSWPSRSRPHRRRRAAREPRITILSQYPPRSRLMHPRRVRPRFPERTGRACSSRTAARSSSCWAYSVLWFVRSAVSSRGSWECRPERDGCGADGPGRPRQHAGRKICGIIATVFMCLGVLALIAYILIVFVVIAGLPPGAAGASGGRP